MEMVNPLAAYREGWDTSQGLFDTRTQRQAGNALAQGDYRGGANALLQGGMLKDGMDVQAFDQKRQAQAQEQERAMQEQAKAAQVQSLKTMLGGAQSLLQVQGATPEEVAANRKQVYQTQVRPLLERQGVPPELLAKFDTSGFTDQELQPFVTTLGGELQKPEWQMVRGPDGSLVAYDQNNLDNRRDLQAPDPFYAQEREAKIAAIRAQEVQRRAAAARAARGPAPRGGGRGRGGAPTSGSSELPPGFVLE